MSAKKKIKLNIKPKDIKYSISNTPLPVVITHDGKIYFDVDPKDEKAILANDPDKIAEYQQKVESTMEYLFLENFLTNEESEESEETEDSDN